MQDVRYISFQHLFDKTLPELGKSVDIDNDVEDVLIGLLVGLVFAAYLATGEDLKRTKKWILETVSVAIQSVEINKHGAEA